MSVEYTLPLGMGVTVTLVIAAVVVHLLFRQSRRGALLQCTAILLMGLSLLGIQQTTPQWIAANATSYVGLIDTSESMSQTDGSHVSRLQTIRSQWISPENLKKISPAVHWQWAEFNQALRLNVIPYDLQSNGPHTDLLRALRKLSNQLPLNVPLVLFSDGNQSVTADVSQTLEQLKKQNRLVHVAALGRPVNTPLLRGYAWADPSICQLGQKVELHLQLQGLSAIQEQEIQVVLEFSDQQPAKIKHSLVGLDGAHFVHTVQVNEVGHHLYTWQLGDKKLAFKIPPVAIVQCVDKPVNVLLLEAQAHWFSRNVYRALQMDQNLRVTARYALGDTRELQIMDNQQSVITDQKLLENQDVIIMGSNVEKMLNASQRQSLAQWVTQGGGLLWLRSSKVHPKLWPKMLVDPHQLPNQSNISQLLAGLSLPIKNQNTQPLLTHWQVGQGHVLKLNDALLNLSVSQNQQMNLLAIRMANWLAKPLETGQGRQAQMHLDRHAALARQTITITLIVRDNVHPQLQVTESDGTTRTLSVRPDITNPLQWFSDLTLKKPGIYWIDLLSHDIKQAVNVRLADDEAMHLSANHTLLRKIARQTGGQFWLSPKQMIDGLKDSQMQHLAKQSQPVSHPRFNHPILVISIISLWLGSWYLTRRKGGI